MSLEHSKALVPSVCRLSVIIPTFNRRALTERAVASVLSQTDPIGIELIIADDGSRDGTADHIENIFSDAIAQKKLSVLRCARTGDPGATRNRGVAVSRGSFLAFLDSDDWWKPGRLLWLEPYLKKCDLLLATDAHVGESADWLMTFIESNWAITSSAVLRRTLFDEVGGFPEGYFGKPLPKRIPGFEDYELWLKCLACLLKNDLKDHFKFLKNEHVASDPEPKGAGRMRLKMRMLREAATLTRILPSLPPHYWPQTAKRIAGTGKGFFRGN